MDGRARRNAAPAEPASLGVVNPIETMPKVHKTRPGRAPPDAFLQTPLADYRTTGRAQAAPDLSAWIRLRAARASLSNPIQRRPTDTLP
jgi:hypothetical protein